MAKDIQEIVRASLISAVEGAGRTALEGAARRANGAGPSSSNGNGRLSGMRGVAAGAGAAALVPVAVKSIGKLGKVVGADGVNGVVKAPAKALDGVASSVGDRIGGGIGEKAPTRSTRPEGLARC